MITCPDCKQTFQIKEIISDKYLMPYNILMAQKENQELQFYFHHGKPGCNRTFSIPARSFDELIIYVKDREHLFGTDKCSGYCAEEGNFKVCNNECKWAAYRAFFIKLIDIKKKLSETIERH